MGDRDELPRHFNAVLLDCQSALDLDPGYCKAYLRKGQALRALGRLAEAGAAAEAGVARASGALKQVRDGARWITSCTSSQSRAV